VQAACEPVRGATKIEYHVQVTIPTMRIRGPNHNWQTYVSEVRTEMPSGMVPVSWLYHKINPLETIGITKKGNLVHREEGRPRCQQWMHWAPTLVR
jgi:hypothetical protein